MIKIGNILNNQWKVVSEMGSGGQGKVFEAINIKDNTPVAVKVVSETMDSKAFERELNAYLHISKHGKKEGQPMIPDFLAFRTSDDEPGLMVMEMMGPDLRDVWKSNGNYCSTGTIIYLFKEVLNRLENLHETGMVHRDIKPENICFGREDSDEIDIRLVDLGMCTPFLCAETGKHLPMKTGGFFGGTVSYCSLNQHEGGSPSRKDDLEAVCYTMMKLHNGYLPWSASLSGEMTLQEQLETVAPWKRIPAELICHGYPQFFRNILEYVKTLSYDDLPNYDHMRRILSEAVFCTENKI